MLITAKFMLLFCFFVSHSATPARLFASQQTPQPTLNGCELNNNYLNNAHHLAGEDSTIIAIARLGTNERSRELNRRRLHNVRVYLTEFGWHRLPKTVVTAEGDRVKGYGRIDLYVRGSLWASLAVRRNQDLIVGSCEPEQMRGVEENRSFYPYKDQKKRTNNR
jgi:hypothetical protein